MTTVVKLTTGVAAPQPRAGGAVIGSARARVVEYALDQRFIVDSCRCGRAREVIPSCEGRVWIGLDKHQFGGGRQSEVKTSGPSDSQQRVDAAGELREFLFDDGRQLGSGAVTDLPLSAIRIVPFRSERRKLGLGFGQIPKKQLP